MNANKEIDEGTTSQMKSKNMKFIQEKVLSDDSGSDSKIGRCSNVVQSSSVNDDVATEDCGFSTYTGSSRTSLTLKEVVENVRKWKTFEEESILKLPGWEERLQDTIQGLWDLSDSENESQKGQAGADADEEDQVQVVFGDDTNDQSGRPGVIGGTYGYGVKRVAEVQAGPKKKTPRKDSDSDPGANWIPLDEYYYGKKEGDPSYTEEKGEYRFKCWYCNKMLYNNVRTMQHIQGHIDSGKQQNLDLSDLTQCKHCYKQFDTPFEMQTHMEKVHLSNKVLMCRICEKDMESPNALSQHMKQNHVACEMPYVCQQCNFRSSMYSDVVDHFKKKHDSSQFLLCLYCLRSFRVKFASQGWGQTQTYYGHLLKHQSKSATKKCLSCRLAFFNSQDVKLHKKTNHTSQQKGVLDISAKNSTSSQVMIKVPESGLHPKKGVKSLNAPSVTKVQDIGDIRLPSSIHEHNCFECKMSMGSADHYKKFVNCSMCRFATSCSVAYASHMMGFHSQQMTSLNLNIPWERKMQKHMYCLCGFHSRYGNKIANHLVFCTKRTCYSDKPDVRLDESGKEIEDKGSGTKSGAALLNVLGLVKRTSFVTRDGGGGADEETEEVKVVAEETVEGTIGGGKQTARKSTSRPPTPVDGKRNSGRPVSPEEEEQRWKRSSVRITDKPSVGKKQEEDHKGEDVRLPKPPDKPMPAYLRYSKKVWNSVKEANPKLKFADMGRLIGQMWRDLPEAERDEFLNDFEQEKANFSKAMKAYYESPAYKAWLAAQGKLAAEQDKELQQSTPKRGSHRLQDTGMETVSEEVETDVREKMDEDEQINKPVDLKESDGQKFSSEEKVVERESEDKIDVDSVDKKTESKEVVEPESLETSEKPDDAEVKLKSEEENSQSEASLAASQSEQETEVVQSKEDEKPDSELVGSGEQSADDSNNQSKAVELEMDESELLKSDEQLEDRDKEDDDKNVENKVEENEENLDDRLLDSDTEENKEKEPLEKDFGSVTQEKVDSVDADRDERGESSVERTEESVDDKAEEEAAAAGAVEDKEDAEEDVPVEHTEEGEKEMTEEAMETREENRGTEEEKETVEEKDETMEAGDEEKHEEVAMETEDSSKAVETTSQDEGTTGETAPEREAEDNTQGTVTKGDVGQGSPGKVSGPEPQTEEHKETPTGLEEGTEKVPEEKKVESKETSPADKPDQAQEADSKTAEVPQSPQQSTVEKEGPKDSQGPHFTSPGREGSSSFSSDRGLQRDRQASGDHHRSDRDRDRYDSGRHHDDRSHGQRSSDSYHGSRSYDRDYNRGGDSYHSRNYDNRGNWNRNQDYRSQGYGGGGSYHGGGGYDRNHGGYDRNRDQRGYNRDYDRNRDRNRGGYRHGGGGYRGGYY